MQENEQGKDRDAGIGNEDKIIISDAGVSVCVLSLDTIFLPEGELDPTGRIENRIRHEFYNTDASFPFPSRNVWED